MSRYRIVRSASRTALEIEINKWLDLGYRVTGGLVYADKMWHQAIFLEE